MQQYSFYSHSLGVENIINILKSSYPQVELQMGEKQNQFICNNPTIRLNYRQRFLPSYQLTEEQSFMMSNLRGLSSYLADLPMENKDLQEKILFKIAAVNSEFTLSIEEADVNKLKALIKEIAETYDAVILVNGENSLTAEDGPHFLNEELKLIVNFRGETEIEDLIVKVDSKYFDSQTALPEAMQRKEKSEQKIEAMGVPLSKTLPPIASSTETKLRNPKEIAERAVALAICNFVAFDHLSGEQALNYLETYKLLNLLSPKEREFLENPTRQRKMQETWKSECIWVLLWALGKVDDLGSPKSMCNLNVVADEDYPVGPNKEPNIFIESVKTSRPVEEILDANDFYYRLDWAVVDARINRKEITQLHPGVVYERHYALNWLINYRNQDWDEVSCDT